MKILITGGTGMIGSSLTELFNRSGHEVVYLSRSPGNGSVRTFAWNLDKHTMDPAALENVCAVVHLAGAGVADKRWTESRKKEIIRSRVASTALLYDYMKRYGENVKVVVSASGAGYYGTGGGETLFKESDPPGKDFVAGVARAWETEAEKFAALNKRVVMLRIGMVLSKDGGALREFLRPVKWFVGAPLGSGNQYISWIHHHDLSRLILKAVEDEMMAGVYNAVSPNPVTNREMMHAVARSLGRPIWLPAIPEFALKMLLGEMTYLVTEGSRVSSGKILDAGYQFHFGTLSQAMEDIFALPHR